MCRTSELIIGTDDVGDRDVPAAFVEASVAQRIDEH